MKKLGLSILAHGLDTYSLIRPWLAKFEEQNDVHVEVNVLEWEAAWPEIFKTAMYRVGPDVSEMGSTWVSSFVALNVLKPFSASEINKYGGTSAFLPAVWQSQLAEGPGSVWALPWLAYMRLIYYRRDLLDKAGINETTAFQSHQQLVQTLERLKERGITIPWCVPTRHSRDTIHNIASWIWSAGGDFVSADGKQILFNKPEALTGMRAYFDLHRFITPPARHRDEADSLFKQGKAAVVMSGPWLWPIDSRRSDVIPQVADNIGVAVPLGTAFIGFSYLVVWKHSNNQDLALKLTHHLSSPEVLAAYAQGTGPLFVRLDALEKSPLAGEKNYQVMFQGLKTGRTFPQISHWGLVEEKLDATLEAIWHDILAKSRPDIDAITNKHLDTLANKLAMSFS